MNKNLFGILFCVLIVNSERSNDAAINLKESPEDLCSNQLKYFQESLELNLPWARKLRDSWGNVRGPSGIFSGNLYDLGNFDQCLEFQHNSELHGEIFGQHCILMIPFDRDNPMKFARISTPSRRSEIKLGIGICVPRSCSKFDVNRFFNIAINEKFNASLSSSNESSICTTKESNVRNGMELYAILFFATFIVLVITSSVYEITVDLLELKKKEIFSSFSIYSNSKMIMTMRPFNSSKEMIFLHGIRSIALIWIVIGHTYNIGIWLVPTINANSVLEMFKNHLTMLLFSSYFGVSMFFMLSSLLLTLSVFRELDNTRKINLPILYLKRYFRISIPLIAGIIFFLGIFSHLSDGPFWKSVTGFHIGLCEDWWWTTLLHISNLVNPGRYCLWHSWYLAVDMQLYFLSPIILYPLWRFRHRTWLMISLIFVIASSSIIFIFVCYIKFNLRTSHLVETNYLKDVLVYTTTVGRIDSWMIGILCGYVIHKVDGREIRVSRYFVIIGWTLTFLVMVACIFGQFPLQQENFYENSIFADATYDSLKGVSWCLSVAWIILACRLSYGGSIKRFLSLSIWFPISKLSFCIYLVHVPVQLVYTASLRSPGYFSQLRAVYLFFGNFGVSFFVAFAWALMFEFPTLRIINFLVEKRRNSLSTS